MPLSKIREIYDVDPEPLRVPENGHGPGTRLYKVDLNFPGVDTQHSTHGLHPYVAAMNPPLARELIKTFVPSGGSVLDPFCGGGGVLVECILAGRQCGGTDINPLAVEVSSAKVTYLPRVTTLLALQRVQDKAIQLCPDLRPEVDPTVSYWFRREDIPFIMALALAIKGVEDDAVRTLFRVALSAAIRDVMLTYRGEVRLRRLRGQALEHFRPNVFLAFQRRALLAIDRADTLPPDAKCQVALEDARRLPYQDGAFSTIICSPPYGDDKNGVGYFQFSRNMLYFLGWSLSEIRRQKRRFLGGMRDGGGLAPSPYLARALPRIEDVSPVLGREAAAFYKDYFIALRELARVAEGRIIIVIGNRVLGRTILDNAKITRDLYSALGIGLEYYFRRTFSKKRIPNLGGDGGGTNVEHIVVFRK